LNKLSNTLLNIESKIDGCIELLTNIENLKVIFYDHSSLENIRRHLASHPSLQFFETKKGTISVSFFIADCGVRRPILEPLFGGFGDFEECFKVKVNDSSGNC
jgi:hypothetical protein